MRKAVLVLVSMALALVLVGGVAWAVTKDCMAGADYCVGTNQNDTINGSEVRDRILAQGGIDNVFGNAGNDSIQGGEGNDTARAGEGSDNVNGQQGIDKVYGDAGDDDVEDSSYNPRTEADNPNVLSGGPGDDYLYGYTKLFGGPGDDELYVAYPYSITKTILNGGAGLDRITGQRSADTIQARDGERDTINCGAGTDTVYFDEGVDSVNPTNCERRISEPQ